MTIAVLPQQIANGEPHDAARILENENFLRDGVNEALNGWQTLTGLTYAGADAPTFTITTATDLTATVGVGMRIKLTQTTGGTKYFIITAITASLITVYGGTDYTLNNETITTPYFSNVKAPVGFPLNPNKWTILIQSGTTYSNQASPTFNIWYGQTNTYSTAGDATGISITVPIGIWILGFKVAAEILVSASDGTIWSTLSTSLTGATINDNLTIASENTVNGVRATVEGQVEDVVEIATKTNYYHLTKCNGTTIGSLLIRNDYVKGRIYARCAYL